MLIDLANKSLFHILQMSDFFNMDTTWALNIILLASNIVASFFGSFRMLAFHPLTVSTSCSSSFPPCSKRVVLESGKSKDQKVIDPPH